MELLYRLQLHSALEGHFQTRRNEFVEDHELQDRPALILQAVPAENVALDLSNGDVRAAMAAGGGSAAEDGWWNGFEVTGQPTIAFGGLTSVRRNYTEPWATECHEDGYVVVGVWAFPDATYATSLQESARGPAIVDFYVQAFRDFGFLVSKLLEAAQYGGAVHLTGTLHLANRLPMVNHHGQLTSAAPKRPTVRWPIHSASSADILTTAKAMGTQFLRLYGKLAPKR